MRTIVPCSLFLLASCTLGALEQSDPILATGSEAPRRPAAQPAVEPLEPDAPIVAEDAPARSGPGCAEPQRPDPALTTRERECGPAADHCLRPNTWFAETNLKSIVRPAFECGGRPYEWSSLEPASGAAYRTRAAADADIAVGATVIYYVHHNGRSQLPLHEHDSHAPDKWLIGVVSTVDTARRTFELERDPIDRPYQAARVIVETR